MVFVVFAPSTTATRPGRHVQKPSFYSKRAISHDLNDHLQGDVTKTGNGEWGMGNGEWGMGNGNGEWGMGN